jgi:putative ABC transport system ATP-binding protein
MLELERVCKRYQSPGEVIRAVDDLSMHVDAGELVIVLGPSGSGKTTLLHLAAGLLHADSGNVRFAGRDLSTLSKREALQHRRHALGFIFQGFNLTAGLTAEENVAIPLLLRGMGHRRARRHSLSALHEVGLARRAGHTPDALSGGEQQRVAIARALVGEPQLILADEPTGNLDSETGDGVLKLLNRTRRERGVAAVLVTHDERLARAGDRVLEMRDGTLTEHSDLPMQAAIGQ